MSDRNHKSGKSAGPCMDVALMAAAVMCTGARACCIRSIKIPHVVVDEDVFVGIAKLAFQSGK